MRLLVVRSTVLPTVSFGPSGIEVRFTAWLPDVVVMLNWVPGVVSPVRSTKVTAYLYAPIPRLVLAAKEPEGAAGVGAPAIAMCFLDSLSLDRSISCCRTGLTTLGPEFRRYSI